MARLQQLFLAFCLYVTISDFGECVHVILGDQVKFLETKNCGDEPAKLYRVGEHGNRLAASREQGVWRAEDEFKDRLLQDSSFFAFDRSVFTDSGLFRFTCGSDVFRIQLDVVVGFEVSVTEGGRAELPCFFITSGQHVDSVRWAKDGNTVLERDLSTGETKYGPGLDGKVSFPADGDKHGDWSLILEQALPEDAGDFFCSVHSNGLREEWGDPAAVRMRVTKRDPDQTTERDPDQTTTTTHPPFTPTECATKKAAWIFLGVVIGAVASFTAFLVWFLKSRSSRDSSESSGGRYSNVHQDPSSTDPCHHENGGACAQEKSGV